jgi:DNA-binding MarR family transcriptional regulator
VKAVTENGRRRLERARRMAGEVEDEVLRGLSAAERRELLKLLRRALSAAPPQSLWRAEEGN